MKLLQHGYSEIQSIEIELRILEETSAPPSRPREYRPTLFIGMCKKGTWHKHKNIIWNPLRRRFKGCNYAFYPGTSV